MKDPRNKTGYFEIEPDYDEDAEIIEIIEEADEYIYVDGEIERVVHDLDE